MGQESRSGSARVFWLGVSPEVLVKMLPGVASSEGSTVAVGSAPKVARSPAWQVGDAHCQEVSVFLSGPPNRT